MTTASTRISYGRIPAIRSHFSMRFMCLVPLLLVLCAASGFGADTEISLGDWFRNSHQFGGRLGAWVNAGDTPVSTDSSGNFRSDINDVNFFAGFSLAYRLTPHLLGELSVADVVRGSVTLRDGDNERIGNLHLTSIMALMRVYPVKLFNGRVHPYVAAGAGFYIGRRDVKFVSLSDPYYTGLNDETRTVFSYAAAAGIDWVLGRSLALEGQVLWTPIDFTKPLVLIEDYRAIGISIGLKYLYKK